MTLIDTHCHLDDPRFDADRAEVVARARAAGIGHIIVPGVQASTWDALSTLRAAHTNVHVAVGVHPHMLADIEASALDDALDDLAEAAKRVGAIAMGEVGFDGIEHKERGVSYALQTRVFDAHVEVAKALGLPLILHVYRAQDVALKALARHAPVRAVVHSYSGSAELVRKWVSLGCMLSFAGAVTRPNAQRPLEAVRAVPLDHLLIETDAPDQAPHGAQSPRCEPMHAHHTLRAIAVARDESGEMLARATTENARRLFGI